MGERKHGCDFVARGEEEGEGDGEKIGEDDEESWVGMLVLHRLACGMSVCL